ncbi:MAG: hypothetical protein H6618_00545 [Deltaproteobacteria bacterium]|nr:hypothetical protein [Deltaproteobacteria bacterium]
MESNRGIFIFGAEDVSAHIARSLNALNFLSRIDTSQVFKDRSHLHIVMAPCQMSQEKDLLILKRLFRRLHNPSARKIIYCTGPEKLSFDQLIFGLALGAEYLAYGEQKDVRLKTYLKQLYLNSGEEGAVAKLEPVLSRAISESDRGKVRQIYARLNDFGKESSLILKMKVEACRAMNSTQKLMFHLKKMLESNSQDIWAMNTLMSLYIKEKRPQKAFDILLDTSDAFVCFLQSRRREEYLSRSLLASVQPLPLILDYLRISGQMLYQLKRYEDAAYLYKLASMMELPEPSDKAKFRFEEGRALFEAGDLKGAEIAWKDSSHLGGPQFTKGAQALLQLQRSLAQQSSGS